MLKIVMNRTKLINLKPIYLLIRKHNLECTIDFNSKNLNLIQHKVDANMDDLKKENFKNVSSFLNQYRQKLIDLKLFEKLNEKIDLFSRYNYLNSNLVELINNIKNSNEYKNTIEYFKANLNSLSTKEQGYLMRVLTILETDPKLNELIIELEKNYYYQIDNCDLHDFINFFKAFYRLRYNGNNILDLMHFYKESSNKFHFLLIKIISNLNSNNEMLNLTENNPTMDHLVGINISFLDDLFKEINSKNFINAILSGMYLFLPIFEKYEYLKIVDNLMNNVDVIYQSSFDNVVLLDFLLSIEKTVKRSNIVYQPKIFKKNGENYRLLHNYFNSKLENDVLDGSSLRFSEKSIYTSVKNLSEKFLDKILKEEYLHNLAQMYLSGLFYINTNKFIESTHKLLNDKLNLIMKNLDVSLLQSFLNKNSISRLIGANHQLEKLNLKLDDTIIKEVKEKLKSIVNITPFSVYYLSMVFPEFFDAEIAKIILNNKSIAYLNYFCLNDQYAIENLKSYEKILYKSNNEISISILKKHLGFLKELKLKNKSRSKQIDSLIEKINVLFHRRIIKRIFEYNLEKNEIKINRISDKYPDVGFYDYSKVYFVNDILTNEEFNFIKTLKLESILPDLNMNNFNKNTNNFYKIYKFIKENESNLEEIKNLNIDLFNYMFNLKFHIKNFDYIVKILKIFDYYKHFNFGDFLYSINKILIMLADESFISHVFYDQFESKTLTKIVLSQIEFIEEFSKNDVYRNGSFIKEFENVFSIVYPKIRNHFDVDLTKLNYHLLKLDIFNQQSLNDLFENLDLNQIDKKHNNIYFSIKEKMLIAYIVRRTKMERPEIQIMQKFNSIEKYNSYCSPENMAKLKTVMEHLLSNKTSPDSYFKKFPKYIYGTKAHMEIQINKKGELIPYNSNTETNNKEIYRFPIFILNNLFVNSNDIKLKQRDTIDILKNEYPVVVFLNNEIDNLSHSEEKLKNFAIAKITNVFKKFLEKLNTND